MIKALPLDPCVHCGAKSESTVCVLFYKNEVDEMFVVTGDGIVCGDCFEESYR